MTFPQIILSVSFALVVLLTDITFANNNAAVFINQRSSTNTESNNDERFSKIDFHAFERAHVKEVLNSNDADDDYDEDKKTSLKHEISFWGRLYIDGFPGENGMQYFRAHFGQSPPSAKVKFILAPHLDDCRDGDDDDDDGHSSSVDVDLIDNDTILVVKRGNCTFGEKAQLAHDLGAGGILLVNNEEGLIHPTAQEKHNLNTTITMISMYNGQRLIQALSKPKNQYIHGKFVSMTCIFDDEDQKNYCDPSDSNNDEIYVQEFFETYLHGMIQMDNVSFKYVQGQFGTRMEEEDSYVIVPQNKHDFHDFCDEESSSLPLDLVQNKTVMVNRGGCNFSKKAENLDLIGAKMMILVNDDDTEFIMGAESDYVASKVQIAAVMVSNETGSALNEMIGAKGSSSSGDDGARIVIKLN